MAASVSENKSVACRDGDSNPIPVLSAAESENMSRTMVKLDLYPVVMHLTTAILHIDMKWFGEIIS